MAKFKHNADSASRCRIRLRLQVFELLGKECVCCGEKHPLLLTFDHIEEDGRDHRRNSCHTQVLRDILEDPEATKKYRVMCISCNQATWLYGTCPHKSGLTIEQTYEGMRKRSALRRSGGYTGRLQRIGHRWILRTKAFPMFTERFRRVQ